MPPAPSPPAKSCGSCSLCCKVMRIDELEKPMGAWCPNFKAGVGCAIYADRPASCRGFHCMWLLHPTMPDSVRPDRCKVVLEVDHEGRRILARADPAHPGAWRQEPIYSQLKRWSQEGWRNGRTVLAMVNRQMWFLAPDRDMDLGEVDARSPFFYEQSADGRITVTIMPPLADGEAYDPDKVTAQTRAMTAERVIVSPPSSSTTFRR